MNLNSRLFFAVLLFVFSRAAISVPFTFEARSLGMGGTSTATADLATAAWANPAMLTNQRPSDDFSLLVGAGVFLRDDDDLISDIKDFQSADDRRLAAGTGTPGEVQATSDMQKIIDGIGGKVIAPEVTGLAAMGMAFDKFAMAVSIRRDTVAGGTVINRSTNTNDVINENFNILSIEGVQATELGVSFAKHYWHANKRWSFGIKPKLVKLEAFTKNEAIINASAGLDDVNKEDNKINVGTFKTFDLGFAVDLSRSYRIGLNVRNLISDSFNVKGQTLNFDTEARIGGSYRDRFMTVAIDYDLIENKPLLANSAFDDLKTKFISVGAEFNTFDIAQLRVGASKNIASGISSSAKSTAITAGIGFWLGFNLDVAAVYSKNSFGGFVQGGFRF